MPFAISARSGYPLEEVAAAAGRSWFQLYRLRVDEKVLAMAAALGWSHTRRCAPLRASRWRCASAAGDRLLEHGARERRGLWAPPHHVVPDAPLRNAMRPSFSRFLPDGIDEVLDRLAAFVREQARG